VLEVGISSPDAIAMYSKNGFRETPLYAPHIGSPISIAMGKDLGPR
jgi:hypothetical protein